MHSLTVFIVSSLSIPAQTDIGLNCIKHLNDFVPLYEALAPEYQPAAFKFYDSDYAFARERITSSPVFIKQVKHVNDIPFTQKDVVGYDKITGGTSLTDLVAQKRVSKPAFSHQSDYGLGFLLSPLLHPIGVYGRLYSLQ